MPVLAVCLVAVLAACAQGVDPSATEPPPGRMASPTAPTTSSPAPSPAAAPTGGPTTPRSSPAGPLDAVGIALEPVVEGLRAPVVVTAPPGDDRLFIAEQPGVVRVVTDQGLTTFLDVTDRVTVGGEQGLLGLAFHPSYASNGRFFVHYSGADGRTVLSEFRVSDDPAAADRGSERVLLTVPQPAPNHNGGTVTFGPDGHLYLGLGDGGGSGDPYGNGQDPSTLLGTILRLDVGTPGEYAIPDDNPFAGSDAGADEVWVYGLRNPWRFDLSDDLVYIADVGQNVVEEIDAITFERAAGANLGWPIVEGSRCFRADDCDRTGTVLPVLEYLHSETKGCAVIGGQIYRGSALPRLDGHYFYGDLCAGFIRSLRVDDQARLVEQHDWTPQLGRVEGLLSFGQDAAGELYVTSQDGTVSRIVPAPPDR